jgi:hypothetical protein
MVTEVMPGCEKGSPKSPGSVSSNLNVWSGEKHIWRMLDCAVLPSTRVLSCTMVAAWHLNTA